MKKKIKAVKLVPYNKLNSNFTQIANSMIHYIEDAYTYKIYSYLCMMHNTNYNYAFPSISKISKDCNISTPKVQKSLNWLNEQGYIVKVKLEQTEGKFNNIYFLRYVEVDYEVIKSTLNLDIEKYTETEIEIVETAVDVE